jgi:hypothetical protein
LTTGRDKRVLKVYYQIRGIEVLVIIGLIVLLVAAIFAIVGVLGNTGAAHPLTENFSVFGYHVTGSTGSLFLFGIVVGAVALLGLSVLLAGARRTAGRGRDARREVARYQREMADVDRDRDTRHRGPLLSRWSRVRQSMSSGQSNGHGRHQPFNQARPN